MTYDVIVVGAGLAGCSAAAQLGRAGLSVLLLEKAAYPVHKLCGEFLSVEVLAAFQRLGVSGDILAARPARLRQTLLTERGGGIFSNPLPGTALGLSRRRLDHLLFEHAVRCGAEAHDDEEAQSIDGSLPDGFTVTTGRDTYRARVVMGAWGKRSVLDRKLSRGFFTRNEPFVAFKAHFEGADLDGCIEMHGFDGGYCGLSHVEDGLVNACWITHQDALRAAGGSPEKMISLTFPQNPYLAARFAALRRVSEDFLAISQISFASKDRFDQDVCMIGDTAGMITPLCGDGMAMALRSAEMVVPLVSDFLAGSLSAQALKDAYRSAWRREFRVRLALGRVVHEGFVRPPIARLGLLGLQAVPPLGRWLIRSTRG